MPHISRIKQHLYFYEQLISLSIMSTGSSMPEFSSFLRHCIYVPHFIYPFIQQRALGCFQCLGFVNNAVVNMRMLASLQDPGFNALGHISRSGSPGSYANSIFNYLRKHHIAFPSQLHFIFLPAVHKSSNFFTLLPMSVNFWVFFYSNHPNECEVVALGQIHMEI